MKLQHDIRSGGAEIHDHIAGLAQLNSALHGVYDDGVGRQDLHHHIAGAVDLIGIGGGLTAELLKLRQTGLRHIVTQNGAAALLYDILRHRQTHDAKTQKTDLHMPVPLISPATA